MGNIYLNNKIVEDYFRLLKNLSPEIKKELITKLTETLKTDLNTNDRSIELAFGAWESKKSAEKIIDEIRSSRTFKREIKTL